jgi:hypothetical protein
MASSAPILRLSSDPKDPTSWPLTAVLRTNWPDAHLLEDRRERVYRIMENKDSSMRKGPVTLTQG